MAPVEVPEPNELVGGPGARFQVIQVLGAGGMGEVCLAKDTSLQRMVAIKTIRRDLCANLAVRKRVERECLLHARVGPHPNIVTLFDKLEFDGRIYLVMEYVDGEVLQDRLLKAVAGPCLTVAEALSIEQQCLDALTQIHQHGIVHRDIKPSNILLSTDRSGSIAAKLMDFGIAYLDDKEAELSRLTHAEGVGPGTPLYMSPEQIDSRRFGQVTPATDIYAMGVLLYEMVSGHPPFTGSFTEIFNGHLNEPVPPVLLPGHTDLSDTLTEVLRRALAKEPEERFPSARAFRNAVYELLPDAAQVCLPPTPVSAGKIATPPKRGKSSVDDTTLQKPTTSMSDWTLSPPGGSLGAWVSALAVAAAVLLVTGIAMAFLGARFTTPEPSRAAEAAAAGGSQVASPAADQRLEEATQAATQAEPFEIEMDPPVAEAGLADEDSLPPPEPISEVVPLYATAAATGPTYEVRPGDTLITIAARHRLDKEDLARWNGLKKPSLLKTGAILLLHAPEVIPDIGPIDWSTQPPPARPSTPAAEPSAPARDAKAGGESSREPSSPPVQRRGTQVRRLGTPDRPQ